MDGDDGDGDLCALKEMFVFTRPSVQIGNPNPNPSPALWSPELH